MKKLIIRLTALLFSGLSSAYAGAGFKPLSVSGCATSIGVSQSLWIIGCSRIDASGYGIYQLYRRDLKGNFSWQQIPGSARKIAISPEGTPWVINEQGAIFRWNGSEFQSLSAPGCATSIGVGRNNAAWVIGCSRLSESGNGIYQLSGHPYSPGATWQQIPGAAKAIAVSPEGSPWVINGQGTIFSYSVR